ncbi:MAG TPA: hypothetical protein VMD27_04570 [Candidatus Aquilonibacter sp.]|nr:hypothetical protein [Candidatus Aquilonibacter sp.]
MRIPIPKNPEELIKLAKAVRDKHVALGTASPLNSIDGITGFSALVDTADSSHTDAKNFAKQAETATEARDNALGPNTETPGTVRFFLTASRDLLAAQNKGSECELRGQEQPALELSGVGAGRGRQAESTQHDG